MSSFRALLDSFLTNDQFRTVFILLAADFVFGVAAAVKTRSFVVKRLADIGKDEFLGKVAPWAALWTFGVITQGTSIAGVGFATIATGYFALVTASEVGSLFDSFQDLGLPIPPVLSKVGIGRDFSGTPTNDLGDQPPAAAAK